VARQCLASMLTYHAMCLPPPAPFLRRAVDLLAHFIALGERVTPGRRAASLYPNRAVSALPWEKGGMRFPDLHAIDCSSVVSGITPTFFFFFGTKALHVQVPAKTNLELPNAIARVKAPEESKAEQDRTPATAPLKTRLLRPRQAAWKVMFVQWLGRLREWVHAHPAVPRLDIDCWGMGLGAIFCIQQLPLHTAADEGVVGGVPARVRSYIRAFRRLHPHRADLATSFAAVMGEPLFFNAAITDQQGGPSAAPIGACALSLGCSVLGISAGSSAHWQTTSRAQRVSRSTSPLRRLSRSFAPSPRLGRVLSYSRRSLYRTGQRKPWGLSSAVEPHGPGEGGDVLFLVFLCDVAGVPFAGGGTRHHWHAGGYWRCGGSHRRAAR
jgi:hypothetical protein